MKKRINTVALVFSFLLLTIATACTNIEDNKIISDGIRFCESTYPYENGILIANFGCDQLNPLNREGKGYILYYKKGKTNMFIPTDGNLSAPKGMFEKDGYLYICDVNKIVVYNLQSLNESPQIILFPNDDLFLNDLAASGNTLYVSITNSGRIYQLDISNPTNLRDTQLVEWLNIKGPNGILIDGNSMYIASYPADGETSEQNVIYKVEDLNKPVAKPIYSIPGQYDGIALSDDKTTLYVSNWTPAEVIAINIKDGQTTKLSICNQLIGPADMTLKNGNLYIPDLPNSRVLIHKLP